MEHAPASPHMKLQFGVRSVGGGDGGGRPVKEGPV